MTAESIPTASRTSTTPQRWAGLGALVLAVGFNLPFATLGAIYDYPDVLRRPAGEALSMFADGGPALILVWYAFMLSALALVPVAVALAVTPQRLASWPGLAVGAAMAGALAGLAQAIGLSRWVFAVPALAQAHGEPAGAPAAEQTFAMLNAWGGVAIGEHIGQVLTALFVLQVALMQAAERRRVAAPLGLLTAGLILVGTGEGVALALGRPGELFSLVTITGFVGLTLWLIATGIGLMRPRA